MDRTCCKLQYCTAEYWVNKEVQLDLPLVCIMFCYKPFYNIELMDTRSHLDYR